MANTKSSDQKQALIIRMIADELRGPGAACFMGEKDSWDAALAIVEGLRAAGYVIVPLEPTEAMKDAGLHAACLTMPGVLRGLVYTGLEEYRAMVEARPR